MKLQSLQDPTIHGKPLWVVYDHRCMPRIICAKLLAYSAGHTLLPVGERGPNVCIWGYSGPNPDEGEAGFQTLGLDVFKWEARYSLSEFYDDQEEALSRLRELTTPRGV